MRGKTKKYITTHAELMKLNGRLISCIVIDKNREIFEVKVKDDKVIFIRHGVIFGDTYLFASSSKNKIENNKNSFFSEIEIADNKDEQLEVGEKIIKDNKDVIKKLSTSPLDFNEYLDKKFKIEDIAEEIVDDFRSSIMALWLKGTKVNNHKKLKELTRKIKDIQNEIIF